MPLRNFLKAGLIALALLAGFATPVAAGPFEDGLTAAIRGDFATAFRLWHPLAEQGDAGAQFNLGLMYGDGQDIPQNVNFAIASGTARTFLDAYDIPYETAPSTAKLETTEVAAMARAFTVLVECWN